MSKRSWGIPLLIILSLFFAGMPSEYMQSSPRTRLHFLRAGQGDAVMIVTRQGRVILIDGGGDASLLRAVGSLLPLSSRTIDLLVLTHPTPERTGGLPEVLRRFHVRRVLLSGVLSTHAVFEEFLREVHGQRIPLLLPARQRFSLETGLTLEVLWPRKPARGRTLREAQDAGLVLRISAPGGTILLTGDMRLKTARALLASDVDLRSDVLQVSHLKTPEEFIDAVSPRLAILSTPLSSHSLAASPFLKRGIALRSSAKTGVFSLTLSSTEPHALSTSSRW